MEPTVAQLDAQIQNLQAGQQQIAADFEAFKQKVSTQIEKILRDADVWDLVQLLETGRNDRLGRDQTRANDMGTQIQELVMQRSALLNPPPVVSTEPVIVNDINVTPLDHETRLMVEAGNPDTISALKREPKSKLPKI